jgi:hypothetical protein
MNSPRNGLEKLRATSTQRLQRVGSIAHPGVLSLFGRTEKNMETMHSWAPPERWQPFVKFQVVSVFGEAVIVASECVETETESKFRQINERLPPNSGNAKFSENRAGSFSGAL